MTTYLVTLRATGAEVYRYVADAPIDIHGMGFATYDHEPAPVELAPMPVGPRRISKLAFIDLLGDDAFKAILAMADQSLDVRAFVKRFEVTSVEPDGGSIHLDDPRTIAGVTEIGAALEAQGIVPAGWASVVLGGV